MLMPTICHCLRMLAPRNIKSPQDQLGSMNALAIKACESGRPRFRMG